MKKKVFFSMLSMAMMFAFSSVFMACGNNDDDENDARTATSDSNTEKDNTKDDVVTEGVEAVDLGLPSGTKWANMNVGAEHPEDYGLFFAWGETVGYGSDTSDGRQFDWNSYKWCNGSNTTLTKYCTDSSYGTVDNKNVLDLEDDAAHVNWGGSWVMPTYDEIRELLSNTTSESATLNGVNGMKFTSKTNGNSIFLPCAGSRYNEVLYRGGYGDYWSASLIWDRPEHARKLFLNPGREATPSRESRSSGFPVRPVLRN